MSKILLVEDDSVIRDAYTILLRSQSYDLDVATNGEEALSFCKSKTYDLILLDLMMPVLDGVGFLKNAKLDNVSPQTRIVVLSNLSSGEEVVQAFSLGAHRQEIKSNLSPAGILSVIKEELSVAANS
jgi:DNA-binding response OmpR family regulator